MNQEHILEISTDDVAYLIELASNGLEEDRAQSLELAASNFGGAEKMRRGFDPGTLGSHEALDRLYMLADNVENFALAHPTVALNKAAYWRVRLASLLLHNAYAEIGQQEPA